jgi:predicted metal-dependent peptidase
MVSRTGEILVHPTVRAAPEEWRYILAHCLLHLGFDHFSETENFALWNAACDCFIARFLLNLKLGSPPREMAGEVNFAAASEDALYREFLRAGLPSGLQIYSMAGPGKPDMILDPAYNLYYSKPTDWQKLFSRGLALSVSRVVRQAAGELPSETGDQKETSPGQIARRWFISCYPLLGALAADFRIVEDPLLCGRMQIHTAAVHADLKEIYLNPAAALGGEECRFVIAHELLHVGLNHHARARGREPYLWNVACDYVINGWLHAMALGYMPAGSLYDPELEGLSAEAVYDRIVTDMRRFRKLSTLRGLGLGDILSGPRPEGGDQHEGLRLDAFYRRCLCQGLVYHEENERGYLPAGLIEEIRSLTQPPIPWDVELARWFDAHFLPIEKRRTYARLSRRQSASPGIPWPMWVPAHGAMADRTFGVVLDTSGSMDRGLLAKALGTIAGYCLSRDVPLVRVVFCDATYYDQGYLRPEAIAETVKVKGRGGTLLQPAIDMLEKDANFPKDGPLLIITDGYCDTLRIRREHAFVLPRGRRLPFPVKGKVFYIR